MKRLLFLTPLLLLTSIAAFSQSKPYNAVFDITTDDTVTHQRVIRWINSIIKAYPDAKLEVVFYGKALPMIETEKSTVASDVLKLAAGKNVIFAVCEQAMQAHKVDKGMLLPGVKTVPDAIYELISKQADGYGYIKVTN
jgi:intracellular sulfur oxidation DsrE/DsrF family protein